MMHGLTAWGRGGPRHAGCLDGIPSVSVLRPSYYPAFAGEEERLDSAVNVIIVFWPRNIVKLTTRISPIASHLRIFIFDT
jgi:hypothetical protein